MNQKSIESKNKYIIPKNIDPSDFSKKLYLIPSIM